MFQIIYGFFSTIRSKLKVFDEIRLEQLLPRVDLETQIDFLNNLFDFAVIFSDKHLCSVVPAVVRNVSDHTDLGKHHSVAILEIQVVNRPSGAIFGHLIPKKIPGVGSVTKVLNLNTVAVWARLQDHEPILFIISERVVLF